MKEIEKILAEYQKTDWKQEKLALGTVVKVEESSYRRIGARMLVSSKGTWIGGISGGCLEGDALKRARIAINSNQSTIVVYDTMEDDSHQIGVGLGCNGRIEVLFRPIDHLASDNPIAYLSSFLHTRETVVAIQVLNNTDTDPNLLGRIYPESEWHSLSRDTQVTLASIQSIVGQSLKLGKSQVHAMSNPSGKNYELLVELIQPKVKLLCIGDNYDMNAMVAVASELGWEIHTVGRMRKLTKTIVDVSAAVYSLEEIDSISIDAYTVAVLMTHDYKTDLHILNYLLETTIPYIGVLGPKKRMHKLQSDIYNQDVNLEERVNVYGPVGLDIGAETPEEIAISIAAEIIASFRSRKGASLRNRFGPIHER